MKRIHQTLRDFNTKEDGATAVEFSLIAIAFLTIVFATMELGRYFFTMNSFQYAIENAARYALATENVTTDDVEDFLDEKLPEVMLTSGRATIAIDFNTISGVDFIEIEGVYDFDTFTPFVSNSWDALDIRAVSRLPIP